MCFNVEGTGQLLWLEDCKRFAGFYELVPSILSVLLIDEVIRFPILRRGKPVRGKKNKFLLIPSASFPYSV